MPLDHVSSEQGNPVEAVAAALAAEREPVELRRHGVAVLAQLVVAQGRPVREGASAELTDQRPDVVGVCCPLVAYEVPLHRERPTALDAAVDAIATVKSPVRRQRRRPRADLAADLTNILSTFPPCTLR